MTPHYRAPVVSLVAAAALLIGGCAPHRTSTGAENAERGTAPSGRSTTASITDADAKSLARVFQGKFPGVDVYEAPGGGIRVRIRNAELIDGRSDPLYIVDGVQVATPDGILFINPNDIAKIEVVKDVGLTALYGISGANGVVKITTKR